MTITLVQLRQRFRAEASQSPAQVQAAKSLAELLESTAKALVELTPNSREQSLALTNLEQAFFWATVAVERQREVGALSQ